MWCERGTSRSFIRRDGNSFSRLSGKADAPVAMHQSRAARKQICLREGFTLQR